MFSGRMRRVCGRARLSGSIDRPGVGDDEGVPRTNSQLEQGTRPTRYNVPCI